MIDNIETAESFRGLAIAKARDYETKTVHPLLVDEARQEGWNIERKNRQSVRLRREKSHGARLEDRVWHLLYRMGFDYLSGSGGASLTLAPKEEDSPRNQIDVVAMDNEVAIAIECKSAEKASRRPQFAEELGKHALIRERFANSISKQFPLPHKRQVVLAMFLSNILLSDSDRARAQDAKVVLFDERDLDYYESLVSQIGPAAKFQFLADMLPGKIIPGLHIRIPAIRTKIGGNYCYTFSITPEYLLKISYVSHRSKGKASDVGTYQRMLSKSRLNRIRDYISSDGIFPTNIVINLESSRLQFERVRQETDDEHDPGGGQLGWLELKPAYKSAWIIDGQHRLFAYSGHSRAAKSRLSVLAFHGMPPSRQAELFIDINAEQKRVKQSLLRELFADLHWDAEDPQKRIAAVISKAIQRLDSDSQSPFRGRIQRADDIKSQTRCITLGSLFDAVERAGLHISTEKQGNILEYGPLWAGDNDEMLERTIHTLKAWFSIIRTAVPEWWDKGSAKNGGGLAMNDPVVACTLVLASVCQHLNEQNPKLVGMNHKDLSDLIRPYGEALGQYLASLYVLPEDKRDWIRNLRGRQGQFIRRRRFELALHQKFSAFSPPGLDAFLEEEKTEANKKAKEIIDRIEITVKKVILEGLRQEFGPDESQWWMLGVPQSIRKEVRERYEEDSGSRGSVEHYFDLIHYRDIALKNWSLFEAQLAYDKSGDKKTRTSWMSFVNDKRKIVSHASSGVSILAEDLSRLEDYGEWLSSRVSSR